MSFETLDADTWALLKKYDTPTVCNVWELLDVRPRTAGYMDRRITAAFPSLAPMVGYASTATFRSANPPRSGNVYAGLSATLKDFERYPGPAVVVFQDMDDPSAAATFGEIMCTTYKTFGAAGLITSGTGRDLDQVAAINFPVFTAGTVCAHGYCQVVDVGVPVHVGGISIQCGDIIHADRNGVTTIPTGAARLVAQSCEEFMQAEAVILEYLKGAKPNIEGFSKAQEECKNRIKKLGEKMRKSFFG